MPRRPPLPGRTFAGLELSHPTNKGLAEEWACAPGRFGGAALLGLKANTKSALHGTAWQPTGRAGGYGQLNFASVSSQYVATTFKSTGGATLLACAFWFRTTDTSRQSALGSYNGGASDLLSVDLNRSAGNVNDPGFIFPILRDSAGNELSANNASTVVMNDGAWHHLLVLWDLTAKTVSMTFDGRAVAVAMNTTTIGSTTADLTNPLFVGALNSLGSASVFVNGSLDDILLWKGVKPSGPAVYDQTRRGNPDRWRWLSRAAWLLPTGGGGNSLTRTAVDAPSAADVAARVFTGTRTASDGPTTADAVVRTLMLFRTAADAPTTADAAARVFVGHRTASDAPATADAGAASKTFIRTASDSPATIDSASAMRTYLRTVMDAPATLDLATRAFTGLRTATDHPLTADAAFATVIGPQQPPSEIIYLLWASGTPILASWSPGNPIMLSWQA